MANKELEVRAFILIVLGTFFAIIASALIGQAICRYCGVEASKELLEMCQKGHPACWPTSLPKEKPKKPPVETTQLMGDVLTSSYWILKQPHI